MNLTTAIPERIRATQAYLSAEAFVMDDERDLLDDEAAWDPCPQRRHGVEPVTLGTVARQMRRKHPHLPEEHVRKVALILMRWSQRGSEAQRRAAWEKLEELYS